jgi:adenosine deaminase
MNTAELTKLLLVNENGTNSLEDYLRGFQYTTAVMQDENALERCMFEVCQDAHNDGVRYLEVRFAPSLHLQKGLTLDRVMRAVIRGKERAELELTQFNCGIILCGIRSDDAKTVFETAKLVDKYKNQGVLAFDIAGPEHGYKPELHQISFDFIRKQLLQCTIHAGEADDSIRSALICGAQRIGHGVRTRDDQELFNFIVNRQIPIEICITSNLQTRSVSNVKDHPVYEFYKRGIVIVPCTDNTMMSAVTLSMEYDLLQKSFPFETKDIANILQNGFKVSFNTDYQQKKKIAEKARDEIMQRLNL